MVVLEEGGIGVDVPTEALAEDGFRLRQVKRRMECRPVRALHAMVRPQDLLPVRRDDRLEGLPAGMRRGEGRSEEHTSELQSLMRISYAVFCLKKKKKNVPRQNT